MKAVKSGFTLVELAVVLAIIALLVGGVLTGKSLIHASELQSVIREARNYITAVQAFEEKYNALPGDMRNAAQYWGYSNAPPGGCTNNTGAAARSPGVCDGDGNGIIEPKHASNEWNEPFGTWQHLASSGLIYGTYNGIAGVWNNNDPVIGTNVPVSAFSKNAGWGLGYLDNSDNHTTWVFNYDMRNWLTLGADVDDSWLDNPMMSDEDAYYVDSKMDDGMPGTGKVIALHIQDATLCTNALGINDYTARYIVAHTGNTCALAFKPPWVQ